MLNKNIIYKNQYFITLLSEIIIEILKYLHPKILIILLQINRKFNQLLSEDSNIVLQIWKYSRLNFLEKRELGSPKELNEREYVQFLLNKKCYFCKKKSTICSWKSLIKIYKKCADKKNQKIYKKYLIDNKNLYEVLNPGYNIDIFKEIIKRKDSFAQEEHLKEIRHSVESQLTGLIG